MTASPSDPRDWEDWEGDWEAEMPMTLGFSQSSQSSQSTKNNREN